MAKLSKPTRPSHQKWVPNGSDAQEKRFGHWQAQVLHTDQALSSGSNIPMCRQLQVLETDCFPASNRKQTPVHVVVLLSVVHLNVPGQYMSNVPMLFAEHLNVPTCVAFICFSPKCTRKYKNRHHSEMQAAGVHLINVSQVLMTLIWYLCGLFGVKYDWAPVTDAMCASTLVSVQTKLNIRH